MEAPKILLGKSLQYIFREKNIKAYIRKLLSLIFTIAILIPICHILNNLRVKASNPFLISHIWAIILIVLCAAFSVLRISITIDKYKKEMIAIKNEIKQEILSGKDLDLEVIPRPQIEILTNKIFKVIRFVEVN
jgi:hypothetical protein